MQTLHDQVRCARAPLRPGTPPPAVPTVAGDFASVAHRFPPRFAASKKSEPLLSPPGDDVDSAKYYDSRTEEGEGEEEEEGW